MCEGSTFLKLTVNNNGGKLGGNVVFYSRILENGSYKLKGGDAVDLINPRLEGKTFVFDAPDAQKHGSADPADQEIKHFPDATNQKDADRNFLPSFNVYGLRSSAWN
jgi:hypothetical protein